MLAIIFLVLGIVSRLIIHIPNFTPVIAISLLGGLYLNKRLAIILPLILLVVSDLLIGWHDTIAFTWGSIVIISAIGLWTRNFKNSKTVMASSLLCSVIFFLITNFGVWIVGGLYPMTAEGLKNCFVLAIPFFKTELLGTLIYTFILYSAYEFAVLKLKNTRWAPVLLSV